MEDAEETDKKEVDVAILAVTNARESTVGPMAWVAMIGRNAIIPCMGIKPMQPWKTAWAVTQKDAAHDAVG